MTLYKVKAERWSDQEWWRCTLEITVDEKGKVVKVEEVDD